MLPDPFRLPSLEEFVAFDVTGLPAMFHLWVVFTFFIFFPLGVLTTLALIWAVRSELLLHGRMRRLERWLEVKGFHPPNEDE